jgi:hypothetical protein
MQRVSFSPASTQIDHKEAVLNKCLSAHSCMKMLMEVAAAHTGVLKDLEPEPVIEELGESSLDFVVPFYGDK